MDEQVELLFRELADLTQPERECYFQNRKIPADVRAEVESLLRFDSKDAQSLTRRVLGAANDFMESGGALPEDTRCGSYRLVRLLGRGGMGLVYLAERTDGEVEQQAAVKLLKVGSDSPAARQRFLQERQILADLSHPNIARLLDAGHRQDGQPYLVMEYIDGQPIDKCCESLPVRQKVELLAPICEAVSYAHQQLVIHRDLKPGNILVGPDRIPKLLDFGIAKLMDTAGDATTTIERRLTPVYASPEQVRGQFVGIATDIYSLGAILYKLLTASEPFQLADGMTASELEAAICNREVSRPSQLNRKVDRDLDAIVLKAMRKEPGERYASVDELADDLKALLELRPVRARHGNWGYLAKRFIRKRWAPLTAIAVALAGIVALSWFREPENSIPVPLSALAGIERHPTWSPDGRQVAFEWNGGTQDESQIYVMQPGSSRLLRLTSDSGKNEDPVWSPDNRWIAYHHFSPDQKSESLKLVSPSGGPTRTILTTPLRGLSASSWTRDGHTLVIEMVPGPHQPASLWVVPLDAGQPRKLTWPPPDIEGDTAPAVSSDGRSVAFCRATGWKTAELYSLDLRPDLQPQGPPRRLTDMGFVARPAWTPDSGRIVFQAFRDGAALWQIDRRGGTPKPILGVPEGAAYPALSKRPGGYTSLVFSNYNTNGNTSILRYSTTRGSPAAPIEFAPSSRSQRYASFSPDGNKIGFTSDRTGNEEIWIAGADGSQPVQLTDLRHQLTEQADWSSAGDLLAFISQDREDRQVYMVNSSGGVPIQLTHEHGVRGGGGWSHDGAAYYYTSTRSGRSEVWKAPRGGGPPQQMTMDGAKCGFESTSGIFYYWGIGDEKHAPLMRRSGGKTREITLTPPGGACHTSLSRRGFYYKSSETGDIFLYDEDSARSVLFLPSPAQLFNAFSISADGRWLLIDSRRPETVELMIMEHFH